MKCPPRGIKNGQGKEWNTPKRMKNPKGKEWNTPPSKNEMPRHFSYHISLGGIEKSVQATAQVLS
jgi:hypothetical protein